MILDEHFCLINVIKNSYKIMETKNTNFKKQLGNHGENLAVLHLEKNNYQILERNFRAGRGEIDIIAQQNNILVFVEVKTKKHGNFGDPITWVTKNKQRQIGRVAQAYLINNNINDLDCRFDVITLTWVDKNWQIDHIENAFWL